MPVDYNTVDVGDEAPGLETVFTVDDVRAFLASWTGRLGEGGSRFTDSEAAQREGFGSQAIIPGRMGMAYLSRVITEWLPDARIEKLDVVFRGPTLQNTKHRAGAIITDKSEEDGQVRLELDVYLEREDGQRPQRGAATVYLPKH